MIVLSGGTGTPKLLVGLKRVFGEEQLKVIVNTAEDMVVSGNLVCPDIDSVIYTLAGMIDRDRWWGVANDSFYTHTTLKRLGYEEQMRIGDRDRATHILRTELMNRGMSLTEATRELAAKFGITADILPMTDEAVSTKIITPAGKLHFQEFWVKESGEPEVLDVQFEGIEEAKPTEAVLRALNAEHVVLIGPSNPITSIGPILSLRGIRELLKRKKVIAISPIVGDKPVSGPAGKFMAAKGFEISIFGVYKCYEDLLDVLVIDKSDRSTELEGAEVQVLKTDIVLRNEVDSERLGRFIRDIAQARSTGQRSITWLS